MIIHADILKWAEQYEGDPFHALLCDPPYHMVETVRRFGKPNAAPAQYGTDGAYQRASKGFMGRTWDGLDESGQGIAFRPETWAALARHLYPGAFGMAFASARGYHRMACAIEDAGLIIHPLIGWVYSTGFPKATRLDTQIDRRAGVDRQVVGHRKHQPKFDAKGHGYRQKDNGYNSKDRKSFDVTTPGSEMGATWEGYRYGGQVLKPAIEPICVFQKPHDRQSVDSITRTGAGAFNIAGGRIEAAPWSRSGNGVAPSGKTGIYGHRERLAQSGEGRWPANLILQHSPACTDTCASDCPVAMLDAQSGESESKASMRGLRVSGAHGGPVQGTGQVKEGTNTERGHNDSGTAARYFFQADWSLDRLEAADPIAYFAKPSRAEREAGLDPMQVRLLREQFGDEFDQDTIDDGRDTPIDNPYQRGKTVRRNIHPCLKPLSLTRYLATLLLPPPPYAPRRILVPFCGSGSEYIGALLAGWEAIVGVEMMAEYVKIAEARIAYWRQMRYRLMNPDAPVKLRSATSVPEGQLELF